MAPSFLASSLASATWPLGWLVALAVDARTPSSSSSSSSAREARGAPHATLLDHIGMQLGCLPRLALAAFLYAHVVGDWRGYAATLAWPWVARIAARNLALVWFVGGITDFFLLADASPFRASSERHKFSERYPRFLTSSGTAPILRDALWSSVSALVAAALEAAGLHAYASGRVASAADGDAWWRHAPTVLLMLTWPYTQNIQFYTLHRLLHRWGTTFVPDVGAL